MRFDLVVVARLRGSSPDHSSTEIVRRALAMFADTPSMEVIVSRAHTVILDGIGARLRRDGRRAADIVAEPPEFCRVSSM